MIDIDVDSFRRLGPDFAGKTVKGVGFDREVLLEAGIEEADGFAAVSSGDNSNILSARVVRETFGVDTVVARIYDPGRAEVYERLGIPTVATVRWTADQVLRRLLPAGSEPQWRDPSGSVRLMEVHVDRSWVGRTVDQIEQATNARIPFIFRMGSGTVPKRGTVFQDGDLLYAAVADARLAEVEAILSRPPARNERRSDAREGRSEMRVAIAGAGNVGRSIAAELVENGHEVLLIDKDPRAIKSESLSEAEWLLADACELSSLEEAGLDTCDVAIAATGDDKANLVMSLLAKTEFGVPRTVGRVNHPKNEWLFTEVWGVDVSVSTPRLMSALVEEAVTVGDLVRLLTFHEGATNLVEMTLPASSPCVGHRIGDQHWPGDVVLVAIIRDGHARPPDTDGSLEAGDELLFVTAQDYEKELAQMLSPRGGSIAVSTTATPKVAI